MTSFTPNSFSDFWSVHKLIGWKYNLQVSPSPLRMKGLDFLNVVDSRTSRRYSIQVIDDTIKGSEFANIRGPNDTDDQQRCSGASLRFFDPGYSNTAVMRSSVTFV